MKKVSILDLVFINEGQTASDAFRNSVKVAKAAEQLGYSRIWVAEHHNMPAIASAATSVVIGHLAANTKTIKIGAGGIMLPNHSPLVIAEQFGTLESLYPGRIELGLGRAPGTDQRTIRALRTSVDSSKHFPDDIRELQRYFSIESSNDPIISNPGVGLNVPLWILGSSTFGAKLAAEYGLPYAFASHFAPDSLTDAIEIYRANFIPSKQQRCPYVTLGVNIIIADTDEEAQYLSSSQKQSFTNMVRGIKMKFQPPILDINSYWRENERIVAEHMLTYSFVGSKETVQSELSKFMAKYNPDELMVVTPVYDTNKKIQSLEALMELDL